MGEIKSSKDRLFNCFRRFAAFDHEIASAPSGKGPVSVTISFQCCVHGRLLKPSRGRPADPRKKKKKKKKKNLTAGFGTKKNRIHGLLQGLCAPRHSNRQRQAWQSHNGRCRCPIWPRGPTMPIVWISMRCPPLVSLQHKAGGVSSRKGPEFMTAFHKSEFKGTRKYFMAMPTARMSWHRAKANELRNPEAGGLD